MIGTSPYSSMKFEFGQLVYIPTFEQGTVSVKEHKILKIDIPEYVDTSDNWLTLLNPDDEIYTEEQRNYLVRYHKYNNWLKENKGKLFYALLPTSLLATQDYNTRNPTMEIKSNEYHLSTYNRSYHLVYFITDYELYPLERGKSSKYYKSLIANEFIHRSDKMYLDIDHRGRNIC